jgi:DNA-binding NarL/FixJ family response regulator
MERIEITLVDKQIFFRNGLYRALEVLECDLAGVMAVVRDRAPDVILLDIDYPLLSGLELCRKIVRCLPSTSVVMLAHNPTAEELVEAIRSGAAAYLSKNTTTEELAKTIKQVCLGEYPINETIATLPHAAKQRSQQFQDMVAMGRPGQSQGTRLSPRELKVIEYLANGTTNKEIAQILAISEQTVKNHVSSILRKMNARDRAHAAALAIWSGWLAYKDLPELTKLTCLRD